MGVERRKQREAAVTLALALWQQFTVHGEALELVEVFKYLGRLLAQKAKRGSSRRPPCKSRGVPHPCSLPNGGEA